MVPIGKVLKREQPADSSELRQLPRLSEHRLRSLSPSLDRLQLPSRARVCSEVRPIHSDNQQRRLSDPPKALRLANRLEPLPPLLALDSDRLTPARWEVWARISQHSDHPLPGCSARQLPQRQIPLDKLLLEGSVHRVRLNLREVYSPVVQPVRLERPHSEVW